MDALDNLPVGKPRVLAVCGPTASGKSDLALQLCHLLGGELVNADSMQVYKGLPVGTAALSDAETGGMPQHLVGFLSPQTPFSVADYIELANNTIRDIIARGKLPVVCGGTGLYLQNLLEGTAFAPQKPSAKLRQILAAIEDEKGTAGLLLALQKVDPEHAAKLHANDTKRIYRSLEAYHLTQKTYAQRAQSSKPKQPPYNSLCMGVQYPRAVLYERINQRVEQMLGNGLLTEARWVYDNKDDFKTAAQAIGYKEFFPYFEGEKDLPFCVEALKQATRRYAKRQITWFTHWPSVQWLQPGPGMLAQAKALIQPWMRREGNA